MRWLHRGVAIAALSALIVASPAWATAWDAGAKRPTAILAGGGAAWLTAAGGDRVVLHEARPGQRPRWVQVVQRDRGAAFAGSLAGVVLENELVIPATHVDGEASAGTKLLAGAFGQSLSVVESCGGPVGGGIDIDGDTIAFLHCGGTIEVRDLSGAREPQTVAGDAISVSLAGHYLAWLEQRDRSAPAYVLPDVVVYDLSAGAESYRIPGSAFPNAIGRPALQSDGKIAFSLDPSADDANPRVLLAWASPAEPRIHKLPLPRRYGYSVTLVRDRIVFARDREEKGDRLAVETGVTDLEGHSRLFDLHAAGFWIDFNGHDIAYTERACRGFRVIRRSLPRRGQRIKHRRCG